MSKPPLIMNICVFPNDDAAAEPEQEKIVDIRGPVARAWLSSFIAWAIHEGKYIEIDPAPGKTPTYTPRHKLPEGRGNRHG